MKSLKEVRVNNLNFALAGSIFVNPVFRWVTAQYPYDVRVHTFYGHDLKKIEKKLKKLIDNQSEPFIFIIRDENAELEDVLFVPYEKKEGSLPTRDKEFAFG